MSGDPNFRGSRKDALVITPGRGPRIVRASRHAGAGAPSDYQEVNLRTAVRDESRELDELMRGLTEADYNDRRTGFGRHVAQHKTAAPGSGDIDARPQRTNSNYDQSVGNHPGIDQLSDISHEDEGADDLLDQPNTPRNRTEYGDNVDPPYEHRKRGAYHEAGDQGNALDQEDMWSMDVADTFTETRRDGMNVDSPTFSGETHRQTEASLDDLFAGESQSFRRRGL